MGYQLRVVAWDDPRCIAPLEASQETWHRISGDTLEIITRPLTAFNDQPLDELSPLCDVMIIDYPHMGQALAEGAITDIHDIADNDALTAIKKSMIGQAQESFVVGDTMPAVASDAACQVSAYRPEKLQQLGWDNPPTDWDAVLQLQQQHPDSVAFSLYPSDIICAVMGYCQSKGHAPDVDGQFFPNIDIAREAIDFIKALSKNVPDFCWENTPQGVFKIAEANDAIAFIPYTFAYTRKTQPAEGNWRFCPLPSGHIGIMGGAGMAVSSQSHEQQKAADFILWYCGEAGQLIAGRHGGQPSGVVAWQDSESDSNTNGFYSDLYDAQEKSFVRPLAPWWPNAQQVIGQALNTLVREQKDSDHIVKTIEQLFQDSKH